MFLQRSEGLPESAMEYQFDGLINIMGMPVISAGGPLEHNHCTTRYI